MSPTAMSPTSTQTDEVLKFNSDTAAIREAMSRLRDAHAEISLADFAEASEPPVQNERRRCRRTQLQIPVVLTPADWGDDDEQSILVSGEPQVGVTRDISLSGIGLTHDHLLASDAAIVQLDVPGEGALNLVLDLRWSVRKSRFSFMSGGRIVGMVHMDT